MAITIKEIAAQLHVSTATVSRALNGKPGVSPQVRQQVMELASELRFTPNPSAQSLSTSKTYAIGFVIKRFLVRSENPFYDRIMLGVEQELEKHGYHLVAITIDEKQSEGNWLPPGLDPRRLDGLIIAGCELSSRVMTMLLSLGIKTVLVGNTLPYQGVDAVSSENYQGAYDATRHLIDHHGHRNIVCICGPSEMSPIHERLQGYQAAMRETGLTPRVVCRPGLELSHGADALREVLQRYPETTAVFAVSDPVALGAMQIARELGKQVPEDLAIIGFDNIPWAENSQPPLTTAYIHKVQMGRQAARRLLELLENGPQAPVSIRVANELVLRRSCGCSFDS